MLTSSYILFPPLTGPKTGPALCEKLSVVLEDFGPEKILLGISDSAANCKLGGTMLEERYPHFTWLPCATHVMDLALKVCVCVCECVSVCARMLVHV